MMLALARVASALLLHPDRKDTFRVVWLDGFPPDRNMRDVNDVDNTRFGLTGHWNLPFHCCGITPDRAFLHGMRE